MSPGVPARWLPPSTGLDGTRPPTRRERLLVLARQARGVFEATWTRVLGDGSFTRVVRTWLVVQGLLAAALVLGAVMAPGAGASPWTITAVVALLILAVAPAFAVSQDASAELLAKARESWMPTPLSGLAWLAGKTRYGAWRLALLTSLVLPTLAAGVALGGLRPSDVVVALVLSAAWLPVLGGIAQVGILRARVAQLQARPAATGLGPRLAALQGQQAPLQIALLPALVNLQAAFFVLVLAVPARSGMAGPFAALVGLAQVLPAGAVIGRLLGDFPLPLFGLRVPAWAGSLLVAALLLPSVITEARLTWKPPAGARGLSARLASLLAWTAGGLLVVGAAQASPSASRVVAAMLPPVLAFFAATHAAASEIGDVGAGRARGLVRLFVMERRTAEVHGTLVGLAALAVALLSAQQSVLPEAGALAAGLAPLVISAGVFGAVVGRSQAGAAQVQPQRLGAVGSAVMLGYLVITIASAAALVIWTVGSAAGGAAASQAAEATRMLEQAALLQPQLVGLLLLEETGAGLGLPVPLPSPGVPGIALALAVQLALAGVAWAAGRWVERRAARKRVSATA